METLLSVLLLLFGSVFPSYGSQGIQQLQFWKSSGGNIQLASTTASIRIPFLANCNLDTDANGIVTCGTDATGGGGGSFPFSATTNYGQTVYATGTPTLWFQSGFFASSTSHLVNASTTQLSIGPDFITDINGTGLSLSSGILTATLGTTIAANEMASADFGDWTCNGTTCTIDTNSVALTTDTTGNYVEGVTSSGSITVGNSGAEDADVTVNLNMGNANTWTALQQFANASSTLFSAGYASSTLYFGAGLADCNSNNVLTWTTGRFGCEADDSTAGGSANSKWATSTDHALAPNDSDRGIVLGRSDQYGIDCLLCLYATSTTPYSLIFASTTPDFDGTIMLITNGTGRELFYINAFGDTGIDGNLAFTGDTSTILLNPSGVQFSTDNDGALTLLSQGGTNNESITLNLDDASDAIGITSSTGVTDINWGAIDLNARDFVASRDVLLTAAGSVIDLGSTGIRFAHDNDGQLQIGSISGGNQENLTLNLDDTANTAVWGSGTSLNLMDFGTIGGDFDSALLRVPYAAAPTISTNGDFGVDSTSGQVKYFDGAVKVLGNGYLYPAFTYPTTTWTGTTTIPLGPAFVGETWSQVMCFTDTGTLNVSFYDGTNRMDLLNASTTVGTFNLATNNTFTAAEKRYVDIGTPASSPTKISCTVRKALTAD